MENNDRFLPQEESDSIDLLPIFRTWLNRWWLIILVMVICASVAVAVTKIAVDPQYSSSFTGYVNNRINSQEEKTSLSSADLSASRSLAYTYSVIAQSYTVLEEAAQRAGLTEAPGVLTGMVTPTIKDDTEIISIRVLASSPRKAQLLAQAIADILTEKGPTIVEGSSLKIIDTPRLATSPSSPNITKAAVIAALVGAVAVLALLTLVTIFNTTLKSVSMLENSFSVPILGTIPRQSDAEKNGSKYGYGYGYGNHKREGGKA